MKLYQRHSYFLAFSSHFIGPDAGLNLTDVRLLEKHQAQSALAYATANRERQFAFEKLMVEV